MTTRKLTSLLLAGLLATASVGALAANDGADASGTKSGATSGTNMPPNSTPGAPKNGDSTDG
ncbi:hypothetical protein, partial [Mesorhizobium japonicum]